MKTERQDKVVVLSLVNNEVVLGRVIAEDDDVIELVKPMQLILDPMSGGIGMIPYHAIYRGKDYQEKTFQKKFIMDIIDDCNEEFKEKYSEYVTGIKLEKGNSTSGIIA